MRDELFDTHFRLGYNRVSTLVNRITSALNIKRFAIFSEKFDFNIIFPDGSYVKVEPNLHRQTYSIVEVKDGDGNTIPVTPPIHHSIISIGNGLVMKISKSICQS
ncbi:hypothetical protein D9603_10965 [Pseudoalteromonas sp. PS5]|nr:hypothetical protein D9603_10965 [Pseudoalteromonas sp. PS5]